MILMMSGEVKGIMTLQCDYFFDLFIDAEKICNAIVCEN